MGLAIGCDVADGSPHRIVGTPFWEQLKFNGLIGVPVAMVLVMGSWFISTSRGFPTAGSEWMARRTRLIMSSTVDVSVLRWAELAIGAVACSVPTAESSRLVISPGTVCWTSIHWSVLAVSTALLLCLVAYLLRGCIMRRKKVRHAGCSDRQICDWYSHCCDPEAQSSIFVGGFIIRLVLALLPVIFAAFDVSSLLPWLCVVAPLTLACGGAVCWFRPFNSALTNVILPYWLLLILVAVVLSKGAAVDSPSLVLTFCAAVWLSITAVLLSWTAECCRKANKHGNCQRAAPHLRPHESLFGEHTPVSDINAEQLTVQNSRMFCRHCGEYVSSKHECLLEMAQRGGVVWS